MLFARNETSDESGDDLDEQFCLPLVGVDDGVGELHFLQLHETAQRGKDRVQYGHFAAHLETLDVAYSNRESKCRFLNDLKVVCEPSFK